MVVQDDDDTGDLLIGLNRIASHVNLYGRRRPLFVGAGARAGRKVRLFLDRQ